VNIMDKTLNAAIIGCGAIFKVHADAIRDSSYAQLVSAVDIDEQKARAATLEYECSFYTDYRELLKNEKIDVVHICTPHYLHAPMAIDAVRAGKHVLVEKPVAINLEQAQEMAAEAKRNNVYIGVCFQNRYNDTTIRAKEILQKGLLGKIRGVKGIVTWHRNEDYYTQSGWRGSFETEGGGVLINQAIHTLDLMQLLAGEVEAIKGNVDTRVLQGVIEVEDTADATIYFKNGAVGLFYATNCYTANSPVELEVHCEKGLLKVDDDGLYMIHDGKKEWLTGNRYQTGYKDYWGGSHKKLIEHFYQCIVEQRGEGYITVEESMVSLKMIEGIYRSSATNQKYSFEQPW
jgi:predicted dehydrogenase